MNKFDKLNYFLIVVIFLLSFTKGVLELLGLADAISQVFIELLILVLFFHSLFFILRRKKIRAPGLYINIVLFAVILISFLLTNVTTVQLVLFFRKFAIYLLFFYALFNINISEEFKEKLFKLIIILFLIQIPAALIKVIVLHGPLEKIVGTMSIGEGDLATMMPLMAITYLIVNYLYYKKTKYIYLILLFLGVGLTSGKKALIFYVIAMFIYLSYIHARPNYFIPKAIFIKKFFKILFLIIIIFPIFISLNPSLNPEDKFGGSVDFEYLEQYIIRYQTLDLKTGVEGDGRADAPFVALKRMNHGGMLNLLLGFGPGEILKSSLLPYKDPLLEKYNIGYGGRIAVVWTLMQIGIIGTILFIIFHFILYIKIKNLYFKEQDEKQQILILSTLGMIIIYFLDFFTYSTLMIKSPGIVLTYFYAIFYVLSANDIYQNSLIEKPNLNYYTKETQ